MHNHNPSLLPSSVLRFAIAHDLQCMQRFFLLGTFVLLLALCCLPLKVAHAQSATATLSGTVQDQNGAIVPGATITVLNPTTAQQRQTTTNDDGYFTFPLLGPGTYTLRTRRDGFAPLEVRDVVLNVGDQKALQIQLKAGDVNATVVVQPDAETVRTDGGVGTVVNRQFVANIPLNGRSLQALIQLTPGVVLTPINNQGTATGGAQFSVNGQRTTSNYFMVDGVSANTGITASTFGSPGVSGSGQTAGTTALGGTNSLVSLDALQEFRIETSTFAAEFGRTPGAQITLITRGGTNQFHGSASYYFRNEALDANDWFANANRRPKPKEREHFFSGVFGGPIKRDRLFFFGSYEGLRLEQPQVQLATVPTAALRAQALPGLGPYLNALPLPNGQDFGNGSAQFAASYSDPGRFNISALRLDGRVTNNVTAFFRFSVAPSESDTRIQALSTILRLHAQNDAYTGGVTWVATPRLTADVRVNWTRNQARVVDDLDTLGGAVIPKASDVFRSGWDPSHEFFQFSAVGGSFSWGSGTSDTQRQFNVVGAVAWSVGAHQLKFGADYRRLLPLLGATAGSFESIVFNTAQRIVAGPPFSYKISNGDPLPREPIISNLSLFAQDTWRASRRLTLTYGLRLERVPAPKEATGRLPRTILGIENDVLQNPRLAPQGTPLFRSERGEIAPRFGVAYQVATRPGWETTLRGGTGIYYDLGLGDIANAFVFTFPFIAQRTTFSPPFPLSAADRTPPALGVDPPGTLFVLDPNRRLPYSAQWNLTWEQGLGEGQAVTIAYVGAAGRRLFVPQQYFQGLAEWPNSTSTIVVQRNLGRSAYKALQLQYRHRLRGGLQAMASYTLGRSQDNASADSAGQFADLATRADVFAREFGTSAFDVRHLFSAAVSYDIPGVSERGLLPVLSKDWGLDLLVRYQSAFPVSPTAGLVFVNNSAFSPRPNVVPGQPLYINDPTVPGGRRFNRAAFVAPAPNQQGNFPRNGLRGLPASQIDLAVRRDFRLGERVRLQLRGEVFNLFNHPNFGAPVGDISNGLFGQPTQMLNRSLGGLNALYQMGGPRSGQLAAKIVW